MKCPAILLILMAALGEKCPSLIMTVCAAESYHCDPQLTIASWFNPCLDLRLKIIRSLHRHPGVTRNVSPHRILSCVIAKLSTIISQRLKSPHLEQPSKKRWNIPQNLTWFKLLCSKALGPKRQTGWARVSDWFCCIYFERLQHH